MIKPLVFGIQSKSIASANDIQAFEEELKLRLPSAFVEFCLEYNGGIPSDENNFYPVPEKFDDFHREYGPSSKKTVGINTDRLFGLTRDLKACDIRDEIHSFRNIAEIRGLFPISIDLFGNSAVLREDDLNGKVYWRDHELWEAPEHPYLMPIAENLETFYNSLTRDPYADR
jgi:hypothetical protein